MRSRHLSLPLFQKRTSLAFEFCNNRSIGSQGSTTLALYFVLRNPYVNCVDDWFHHLLTDAHLFWGCWIPLLFVRWGMGDITNSFGTLKIKTSDSHHFRCLILWVNRYQMFVDPLGVTGFVARRVISLFQQFALSVMNYSRYRIQHEFMNVNRLP